MVSELVNMTSVSTKRLILMHKRTGFSRNCNVFFAYSNFLCIHHNVSMMLQKVFMWFCVLGLTELLISTLYTTSKYQLLNTRVA